MIPSMLFLMAPIIIAAAQIQHDQIAKTVYLNDTSFVAYNASEMKCRIDCADPDTMATASFRGLQKIWMFNDADLINLDDKTFIDSNKSIEFQVLTADDAGSYQCCVRSTDMAYQSFICYRTQLIVMDELPIDEINGTEAPMAPSWNVVVMDGMTINAQPEANYFMKIFEDNATDIHCLVNHILADIHTENSYPPPVFNDVAIWGFNVTEHSGVYVCNGTISISNETTVETVEFTVAESMAENENAEFLPDLIVREAQKSNAALLMSPLLFVVLLRA
ncbi:unnamed protein product [Caenorhabditis bovis]|uniref:Ig-like domain-containing protein n=1 Tax=Caenorhabditis bovis TaxID=2654633 RepID=A0A8S1ETW5_9PELO|nr:unnamed protein product [Caenorhabditis bovis]